MNLVRAALIGLALGLLAIGLPGSEETVKRQCAGRLAVYAPRSYAVPEPAPVCAASPRFGQAPSPMRASPPTVSQAVPPAIPPQVCQVAPPAPPAESIDARAEEPVPDVQPATEDPVPLAAMNRPLSLDEADLPAVDRLTKVLAASEPKSQAAPSAKREVAKVASAPGVSWDSSDQPTGGFEQAEVKLTRVLTRRSEPDAEVTVRRADSSTGLR